MIRFAISPRIMGSVGVALLCYGVFGVVVVLAVGDKASVDLRSHILLIAGGLYVLMLRHARVR